MDEQRNKRAAELDDFWDIDALIPQRMLPKRHTDTQTTELILEPPTSETDSDDGSQQRAAPLAERRFIPPHTAEERKREPIPDEEYHLQSSLIDTVRLFPVKTTHSYYESFLRDAVRLSEVHGQSRTHVPFFSYVPQYTQMTRAQLEWYLWWRENFRQDIVLTTDYSYLLLYAYELIHLAERMDPNTVQAEFCKLWLRYRDIFHQLDQYLPEWICDHGLLYRLPPPTQLQGTSLYLAMSHCTLKEYYMTSSGEEGLLRGLLTFCSNYDFQKSKFYTPETKRMFETMIFGALREVLMTMSTDGTLFHLQGMDSSRMVREAYHGAICSGRMRKRIAVEYESFHCSYQLRYLITDVVKYTENHLRASFGIRSRLSIYALPTSVRTLLDAYLQPKLPKRVSSAEKKRTEEEQLYAQQYDCPRTPLSLSRAAEIERTSWQTTERLVEAFDGTEAVDALSETGKANEVMTTIRRTDAVEAALTDEERPFFEAMRLYLPFLEAVLHRNGKQQTLRAKKLQKSVDVLADEINELAAEYTGDILLEEADVGFAVIEDYVDLAQDLLASGRSEKNGEP